MTPARLLRLAILVLLAVPAFRPQTDPDFWWHLATGRWILANHRLPATDPFSWGALNHPWVLHEWLFEVALVGIHHLGGLLLVSLVLGGLTLLALLVVERSAEPVQGYAIRPLLLGLGMLAAAPILGPRVQMLTFLFSAVTLWVLWSHRRTGSRWIWILPPLVALWANLHGGFVVAFLWIGIFGIATLVEVVRGERPRTALISLSGVALACIVAAMLTPYGPASLAYPLATLASPAQQSLILEWHSPDFHLPELLPLLAFLVLAVILLAGWRRVRWLELSLVVVPLAMTLQSVRHIPLLVAAAYPGLCLAAEDLYRRGRGLPGLAAREARPRPRAAVHQPLAGVAAGWLGLAMVVLAVVVRTAPLLPDRAQMRVIATQLPVDAAQYLRDHGERGRILNQYEYGGYLVASLPPRQTYLFGDAALMGDRLLGEYRRVFLLEPGGLDGLGSMHATLVVCSVRAPLAQALIGAGWSVAHRDSTALVLRAPPPEQIQAQSP